MKIYLHKYFLLLLLASLFWQCNQANDTANTQTAEPTKVALKKEAGQFQLYVGGKPFWINGAGLASGDIELLAKHGGNSFRTWSTNNGRQTGKEVLDLAYKNGLYVTMGLDVACERHGFDYNDEAAVAKQFERIKKEVLQYKDHPALIIWAIGNELNHHASNPKVWNAVNQISKYIHEVDPNHLTTTMLAGFNKELINEVEKRAPDIDLLSFQMYADIVNLPTYIKNAGLEKAYMVTEWGATGHWEIQKTDWDIPIENNSSVKADLYLERFRKAIEPCKNQCVGSYVFLWGQKQERTPTWYGMFLENGEETESVDVMHYLWKGEWPANRTPRLDSFLLNGRSADESIALSAGKSYQANAFIKDQDGDSITYKWDVKLESTDLGDGGDHESVPPSFPELIAGEGASVVVTMPAKPGNYRLFIYASDGNNHAAHANIPFLVKNPSLTLQGR